MKYFKCSGLFLTVFISLVMCQDRILVSNLNVEETFSLSSGNATIPESLLIQMSDVQNISQLLSQFISRQEEAKVFKRPSRNGTEIRPSRNGTEIRPSINETEARRALSAVSPSNVAQPANCQTEQHVIELDKPENGATIYWPSCVRVRRCGGCCTSSMLACKPLVTSILNVTVLQMFYNIENPNSFESQGTRTFAIEQHDRCACSCKEREEDCDPDVQDYRANECRCVCKNAHLAASCTGPKRVWDSRHCLCKCRKIRMCSTGSIFNVLTCRCEIQRRTLAAENLNLNTTVLQSTF